MEVFDQSSSVTCKAAVRGICDMFYTCSHCDIVLIRRSLKIHIVEQIVSI